MSRAGLLLFGLVALLFLRGSSCTQIARPYPPPKADELVSTLRARAQALKSLRAETRMSHRSEQGKVKATVRLMARRGGQLRCDAVTPFDTPLMTLVVSGGQFGLIDAEKNRHFFGPATPCNIARLLQVMLQPDDILTVLGGATPLIAYKSARLEWDARQGAEVLTLSGGEQEQTIRLDGHDRSFDLLLSEVRNRAGEVVLRLEPEDYHALGGLRAPRSIKVTQPKLGAELEVLFKQEELNLALPEEAFALPAGRLLDRAQAVNEALVLLAHGSADPRWGEPLRAVQAALAGRAPGLPVLLAALKGDDSLETALARAARLGAARVLVVPVFLSGGGHLLRDVPELVARAAASQPQLDVRCAATLGEQPEVVEAMAAACLRLLST